MEQVSTHVLGSSKQIRERGLRGALRRKTWTESWATYMEYEDYFKYIN